jgi:hypothetical protein
MYSEVQMFFFLEYAGELCIFALRRKDPNTETTPPPLGSERGVGLQHF